MRLRPLLIILCIALLAAGGGYAALRLLVDSEAMSRQLGEVLARRTGHPSRVLGGVRVIFDPDPTVAARDVIVDQAAPFAGQEPLLRLGEVRFNLRLAPLFFGRVEVRGVVVERPCLTLLTDGQGRNGWDGLLERLSGDGAVALSAAPPLSIPREATGASGSSPPASSFPVRFSPQVAFVGVASVRIDDADLEWRNTATDARARVRGMSAAVAIRNGRLAEATLRHTSLEWRAEPGAHPAVLRDLDVSLTPGNGWKGLRDLLPGALVGPSRRAGVPLVKGAGPGTAAGQDNEADKGAGGEQRGTREREGALRVTCAYDVAPGVNGLLELEATVIRDVSGDVTGDVTGTVPGAVTGDPVGEPADMLFGLLPGAVHGTARVRGHVPLDGQPVPLALSVPFKGARGAPLRIIGARLQLEQDAVDVTASVSGLGAGNAVARGTAEVRHLSLPRWFDFARTLPAGLQHALDALSGRLEFTLTRHGLNVPSLEANVLGMSLRGSGGVADFGAPVIAVAVAGADIDMNRIMPELTGAAPHPPVRIRPPGMGAGPPDVDRNAQAGEGQANGDVFVGYDIRVRAEKARGWKFDMGGLTFRCSPSREGALLEFAAASFYGGTAQALLNIADDYRLQFTAAGVDLAHPAAIVSGREAVAGRLAMNADLRGRGQTVAGVVAAMRGTLDARIDDGFLQVLRNGVLERQPFVRFELRGEASGQGLSEGTAPAPASGRLARVGVWRTAMRTSGGTQWEATASGPLLFDTTTGLPVAADRLLATVRLSPPPGFFDRDRTVAVRLSGPLRFDLDAGTLRTDRLEWEFPGARGVVALNATGLNTTAAWTGTVTARFPDPRATLRELGVALWKMGDTALRSAELSASMRQSGDTFTLSDARLVLDGQPVTGSVSCMAGRRPLWRFTLHADRFDADRYLPPPPQDAAPGRQDAAPGRQDAASAGDPLHYAWLRGFDADGSVTVGRGTFKQLRFDGVTASMVLRDGRLEVAPIASGFYGGALEGSIRATAGDALAVRLVLAARDFDLEPVGMRFAGKEYVGGTATLLLDVQGPLHTAEDMPAALSGTWSFEVRDGFYSTRGRSSTPEQPGTRFSTAQGSGFMRSGVLHNEDFTLNSPLLTMAGRGWVDLARKRIDYTTDVSLLRVPTFPIRFRGDLHKPETSVRQTGIITGTLTNLGSTVFDLLGGVIGMPLRVLEGLHNAARGAGTARDGAQQPGQ